MYSTYTYSFIHLFTYLFAHLSPKSLFKPLYAMYVTYNQEHNHE